ncbi:MAG: glycoside hydrolase family 28 protein, partial [Porphyromonadaceae bacterium]|nr:glycoside hydrolase family 28 protein [Porphyromonadaceae bacterium]
MKKEVILSCMLSAALPFFASCKGANGAAEEGDFSSQAAWKQAAALESSIQTTAFPERTYLITDFGAQPDMPEAPCHDAINLAIVTCSQQGGGTVIVPAGTFYTGPLTLKSNVNLCLEDSASVLKFVTDPELYLPAVLTRWEGIDCYNMHPLIYAYGETNIAITGKGIIDGQGSMEYWWPMCGAKKYGWEEGMIGQNCGGRAKLLAWGESGEPIYKRVLSVEDGMRPQLVNLSRRARVLMAGGAMLTAPFWPLHP